MEPQGPGVGGGVVGGGVVCGRPWSYLQTLHLPECPQGPQLSGGKVLSSGAVRLSSSPGSCPTEKGLFVGCWKGIYP